MSRPPIVIRSAKNERLREVRALGTAHGRKKQGRFVLEGPKVIEEALASRPGWLEQVLVREGATDDPRVERALRRAGDLGLPTVIVAPDAFDGLAPSEHPQPLLAVARQGWTDLPALLGPPSSAPRAVVALAGVQDPGNVGTILRTARFFGLAGAVLLPGAQDPWSPKVVRASAGALLAAPPARAPDLPALLAAARAAALAPVALDAHAGEDPRRAPGALPARALLLLGAEGGGLPADLAQDVRRVRLAPGDPEGESLNVAVAFGVVAALWAPEGLPGGPPGAG
ncbi:MAG: RNA methyltransferase [Planctomycetes bacterium]|nr:RNA methyltransferase [Planctomycetota bacterium]